MSEQLSDHKDAVHKNDHYDWDGFGAQEYYEHNYSSLRGDDAVMLSLVNDWFGTHAAGGGLHAVDVGAGTNLYPALSLLRHSEDITLYEYSAANVQWLRDKTALLPESWSEFANRIKPAGSGASHPDAPYDDDADDGYFGAIRAQMRRKCSVRQGSIFDLPRRRWEIGTMFFVAESLTEDHGEFCRALDCFLDSLVPGAPFVAAFMSGSQGYDVDGVRYPAVSLDERQLEAAFAGLDRAAKLEIHRVGIDPVPIRPGYDGYLVTRGKIKD